MSFILLSVLCPTRGLAQSHLMPQEIDCRANARPAARSPAGSQPGQGPAVAVTGWQRIVRRNGELAALPRREAPVFGLNSSSRPNDREVVQNGHSSRNTRFIKVPPLILSKTMVCGITHSNAGWRNVKRRVDAQSTAACKLLMSLATIAGGHFAQLRGHWSSIPAAPGNRSRSQTPPPPR